MQAGPTASQVTQYTAARYPLLRKYHVGLDPLDHEALQKKIEPTSSTKQHVTDLLVRQMGTDSDTAGEAGRLTVATVNKWRQKKLLESIPGHVDHWFAAEFMRWLRGVSAFNSRAVTPWGTENLLHIPEVLQYLREALACRADFQRKLVHLSMDYPRTLNDAYLYYKYIVMHYGWTRGEPSVHSASGDAGNYAPSYMTIGGMLDFLDDFAQTTFLKHDLAYMQEGAAPDAPLGMGRVATLPEPDGAPSAGTNTPDTPDDPDPLANPPALNTAAATIAGALVQQAQRLSTNPDDPDDNDDDDDEDDDDNPPSQLISAKAHKAIANTATTALNATYSAMLSALSGAGRMVGSATQAVVNAALTPEGDDATPDDAATATGVAASVANAAPAPPAAPQRPPDNPVNMASTAPAKLAAQLPDITAAAQRHAATPDGQAAVASLVQNNSIDDLEDDIENLKGHIAMADTKEELRVLSGRLALAEAARDRMIASEERSKTVAAYNANAAAYLKTDVGKTAVRSMASKYDTESLAAQWAATSYKVRDATTNGELMNAIKLRAVIKKAWDKSSKADAAAKQPQTPPGSPPPAGLLPVRNRPGTPGKHGPSAASASSSSAQPSTPDQTTSADDELDEEMAKSPDFREAKGVTDALKRTLPDDHSPAFMREAEKTIAQLKEYLPRFKTIGKGHMTREIEKLKLRVERARSNGPVQRASARQAAMASAARR